MDTIRSLAPSELREFLLAVAPRRPVMIWGPPGVGKSALVEGFSADLGMDCVTLLGSQLAPEDLLGVPQILQESGKSRFCPPTLIARDKEYVLFLDEINLASDEVKKAFYSLIHDRRLGEWTMPEKSVIIAAGNRSSDSALVSTLAAPLMNRMIHVAFELNHGEWMAWAEHASIHVWVTSYLRTRPDHLASSTPKVQDTFTTPRSWHLLSDALHDLGPSASQRLIEAAVYGTLSSSHGQSFLAFIASEKNMHLLGKILKGDASWPLSSEDLPLLQFLVGGFRMHLLKNLPADRAEFPTSMEPNLHRWKAMIAQLAEVYLELAQVVLSPTDQGKSLPTWFLGDIVRDLPRLASRRQTASGATSKK